MTTSREIAYLSEAAPVSMADKWFEIATTSHFWIHRRFEVLGRLCSPLIANATAMAEIGCGNGLLQRQIEDAYGKQVTGFDLNEMALKLNVSRVSPIICYNIYQRHAELQRQYDLIFLFDVLEHISDEGAFLEAVKFHMAPKARLIVNVPAGQWAFSAYDRAAGHVRRYSIERLRAATAPHNLTIANWSYWGLPLLPALAIRKAWLAGQVNQDTIISKGFDSRTRFLDRLLYWLARCEPIPQKLSGTSLLAVFQLDE